MAAQLHAGSEWTARDPFGRVKPADASGEPGPDFAADRVALRVARNGYASVRVWGSAVGEYRLRVEVGGGIEAGLFRCWYHRMASQHGEAPCWLPDALVPVPQPFVGHLPDPDNAIEGQTHQEFWLDLFVPAAARRLPVSPLEVSASLWVPVPGDKAVTVAVHNGTRHRYDTFGQVKLPTLPEMREVLETGQMRRVGPAEGEPLATVPAPVRDSLSDVGAIAELTAATGGPAPAWS